MLPCLIVFLDGIAAERVVGFDAFGNRQVVYWHGFQIRHPC